MQPLYLACGIILLAIVVVAIAMNGLVVVAFLKRRVHLIKRDIILVSMAISDILQSVIGYPMEIDRLLRNEEIKDDTVCHFIGFSVTLLALVSIGHLSYLAVERCLALKNPYFFRKTVNKWRWQFMAIALIWVYGCIFSAAPYTGEPGYARELDKRRCSIDWSKRDTGARAYFYSLFIFCFFFPVVIMAVCSLISFNELKELYERSKVSFGRRRSSQATMEAYLANRKHSVMVLVMAATFITMWTPYAVVCFFVTVSSRRIPIELLTIAAIIAKCSTIANPIIYTFMYSDFKRSVRLLFCKEEEKLTGVLLAASKTAFAAASKTTFVPRIIKKRSSAPDALDILDPDGNNNNQRLLKKISECGQDEELLMQFKPRMKELPRKSF